MLDQDRVDCAVLPTAFRTTTMRVPISRGVVDIGIVEEMYALGATENAGV